jgi:hypothetical protein
MEKPETVVLWFFFVQIAMTHCASEIDRSEMVLVA